MATTAVPLSEYLATSYESDRDYVDGEVQERNLGEYDHAALQGFFVVWFGSRFNALGLKALPELRYRVRPGRYRIPDVVVLHRNQRVSRVLEEAPLIAIEILSPEDRLSRLQQRLQDYADAGVQHIWVFDPAIRAAYRYVQGRFEDMQTAIDIPGEDASISPVEIWTELEA